MIDKISADIKAAMIAQDKQKLEALRAVKAALLIASTEKGADGSVSDENSLKVLQKLVKQRKESAEIYSANNKQEMADVELSQAKVIEAYLPAQMSEDEVREVVKQVVDQVGASQPSDMGKVMGPAMGRLSGKADGKMISKIVKELLS